MQKRSYSRLKKWIKDNEVLDIIIFGSSVRNKSRPDDVDLCILIKDSEEEQSLDLIDSLGKITDKLEIKSHISILTSSSFLQGNSLAKTLLNEGYSIKKNKNFSAAIGYSNNSLFVYSLKHFSSSKRVRFHYMLKGRYGSKGILAEVKGEFLGTGSIVVPTEYEDLLKEVFDKWEVKYEIKRILLG